MSQRVDLGDYIDVAERIAEFRAKYPEGSLQPADLAAPYRIETVGSDTFVVVVAAAYRAADDTRPGIGMAYEPYPGRTSFTRGSELQNAETSAWGRAIVAALAADTKRGIASAQEVHNRTVVDESAASLAKQAVAAAGKRDKLLALHARARDAGRLDDLATNEDGEVEPLGELIVRLGKNAPAQPRRTAQRKPVAKPVVPEPDLGEPAEPTDGSDWPEAARIPTGPRYPELAGDRDE